MSGLVSFLTGSLNNCSIGTFESEQVKRLILANNLIGKHGGPATRAARWVCYFICSAVAKRRTGFQRHVMAAWVQSPRRWPRRAGRKVSDLHRIACRSVRIKEAKAVGVVLESGDELNADVVVSNADRKAPFSASRAATLDARIRAAGGIDLHERSERQGQPGAERRITRERHTRRSPALQKMLYTLVPIFDQAQKNYQAAQMGMLDPDLWVDCVQASAIDPELATPEHHVLTTFRAVRALPPQGLQLGCAARMAGRSRR